MKKRTLVLNLDKEIVAKALSDESLDNMDAGAPSTYCYGSVEFCTFYYCFATLVGCGEEDPA